MARNDDAPKRCAIYTRKSSEEGLEQNFNSLHAQRHACEAFVLSQTGEGWRLVKTAYDDGGFSGATMDRPALKVLLAHVKEKRIDVVVVYKIDRPYPLAGRFRQDRGSLRCARSVVRRGYGAVQHHHLDGPIDPKRAALVCPVRARGDRRADPRQDRGFQAEGDVDGRRATAGLRSPRSAPGGK